jgi:hypothetical protein
MLASLTPHPVRRARCAIPWPCPSRGCPAAGSWKACHLRQPNTASSPENHPGPLSAVVWCRRAYTCGAPGRGWTAASGHRFPREAACSRSPHCPRARLLDTVRAHQPDYDGSAGECSPALHSRSSMPARSPPSLVLDFLASSAACLVRSARAFLQDRDNTLTNQYQHMSPGVETWLRGRTSPPPCAWRAPPAPAASSSTPGPCAPSPPAAPASCEPAPPG